MASFVLVGMRIRIVGTGEYRKVSMEYDILRTTTVMMVKLQITAIVDAMLLMIRKASISSHRSRHYCTRAWN